MSFVPVAIAVAGLLVKHGPDFRRQRIDIAIQRVGKLFRIERRRKRRLQRIRVIGRNALVSRPDMSICICCSCDIRNRRRKPDDSAPAPRPPTPINAAIASYVCLAFMEETSAFKNGSASGLRRNQCEPARLMGVEFDSPSVPAVGPIRRSRPACRSYCSGEDGTAWEELGAAFAVSIGSTGGSSRAESTSASRSISLRAPAPSASIQGCIRPR